MDKRICRACVCIGPFFDERRKGARGCLLMDGQMMAK